MFVFKPVHELIEVVHSAENVQWDSCSSTRRVLHQCLPCLRLSRVLYHAGVGSVWGRGGVNHRLCGTRRHPPDSYRQCRHRRLAGEFSSPGKTSSACDSSNTDDFQPTAEWVLMAMIKPLQFTAGSSAMRQRDHCKVIQKQMNVSKNLLPIVEKKKWMDAENSSNWTNADTHTHTPQIWS